MNLRQVEYFFAVASCLNFSKAAQQLFMTQPALGRQIRALEDELDLELFVRGKRHLELTPAGKVMFDELGDWIKDFNTILEKAQLANSSITNKLEIGILEGHQLGPLFPAIYDYYKTNYPHIQVDMHRASFGPLIEKLYQGDVDIIITLDFDVMDKSDIEYRSIAEISNYLVIPKKHRLADKENLTFQDFKNEVFIVNSPEDSRAGYANLVGECENAGLNAKFKPAASLDEYMLWLEIGYGITVLSEHNNLKLNPNLKFISIPEIAKTSIVVAWLRDNTKQSTQAFIDTVELLLKNNSPL